MAILSEKTWERHSNPWSGWTRVISTPVLAAGLYLHNFWLIGAVVVWSVINPIIFPKPKNVDNWMSKGVIAEKRYYQDGKKFKKDIPTLLNILNIPVFLSFLFLGWQQELVPMIFAGLLATTLKFWAVDRMIFLTDGLESKK